MPLKENITKDVTSQHGEKPSYAFLCDASMDSISYSEQKINPSGEKNLNFVEEDGTEVDCYMNIDLKQNDSGYWFYSFAIEKGSRPADVLSVVTDKSATTSTVSITENAEKSNPFDEKTSKNSLSDREYMSAVERGGCTVAWSQGASMPSLKKCSSQP